MTSLQQQKIKDLVEKYNDILLQSMKLAIAEDFINLIILNRDDKDFELNEFLNKKDEYYNLILKEFLKKNSSSVINELREMEDPMLKMKKRFSKKTPH